MFIPVSSSTASQLNPVAKKKNGPVRRSGGDSSGAHAHGIDTTVGLSGVSTRVNQAADQGADREDASGASSPSSLVMRVVSVAVMVHLAIVAVAYLAVVRSSGVQGRLVDGFAPYLAVFHWAPEGNAADAVSADGVAFFLARGDGSERVYRLEVARGAKPEESQWQPATWVVEGGSERARRYQRFLAAIAELGTNDQNALAGRLLLPALRRDAEIDWIRVTRLPNLMTNVIQDAEPPPYTAAVLREGGEIRLVRVAQPRLVSAATP